MECVISPWWFYFASLADGLILLESLTSIASLVAACFFMYACADEEDYDGEDSKFFLSFLKKSCLVFIISTILLVLTPSKETVIQMLLANNITYDLMGQTTDVVTTVYNDIINLFSN